MNEIAEFISSELKSFFSDIRYITFVIWTLVILYFAATAADRYLLVILSVLTCPFVVLIAFLDIFPRIPPKSVRLRYAISVLCIAVVFLTELTYWPVRLQCLAFRQKLDDIVVQFETGEPLPTPFRIGLMKVDLVSVWTSGVVLFRLGNKGALVHSESDEFGDWWPYVRLGPEWQYVVLWF